MLTPAQLRAARALVGWSRETLAEKAGVSAQTVTGFELLGADSHCGRASGAHRPGPCIRALVGRDDRPVTNFHRKVAARRFSANSAW